MSYDSYDEGNTGRRFSGLIVRHYRPLVFGLVLLNTALIVFLLVYIWTYGFPSTDTRSLAPGQSAPGGSRLAAPANGETATVVSDRLIIWSRAGGLLEGAESRGVLEEGRMVSVIGRESRRGELWLEIETAAGKRGWAPASGFGGAGPGQ